MAFFSDIWIFLSLGVLTKRREDLSNSLGIQIEMIHIDECIYEGVNCEGSCINYLDISEEPVTIYTNTSSFVGVQAVIKPHCGCEVPTPRPRSCNPNPCLNNGTCKVIYSSPVKLWVTILILILYAVPIWN